MHKHPTKILFVFTIMLIALTTHVNAQEKSEAKQTVEQEQKLVRYGFIMDQDMFVELAGLRNEDQNYTMGFGLFLTNNRWADKGVFRPLKKLGESIFADGSKEVKSFNAAICLGVTAFTPQYLGNNQDDSLYFMRNDRPFASLLFVSFKHQSTTSFRSETNQFVLGILGLQIAEAVQTHIHRQHWFGSTRPIPYGWENQISDGFEPTFLLSNKVDRLLNRRSLNWDNKCITTQFIFSREYRVGYYTGANAAIAMRIGFLDVKNWISYDVYQLQYANNLNFAKADKDGSQPKLRSEFYFQASIRPQVILYNAMLNGQLKNSFHVLNFRETTHFVLEGFAGLGTTITNCQKNFSISLLGYLSARSPEFRTSLTNRSHAWGGVQLVFTRLKP